MKRAVIRKGDPTSHGGTVLEGCERVRAGGQPVASKGHMTYCPACRGDFPIVEGVPRVSAFGAQVAVDGMKTACGATLIATQHSVNIDMGNGLSGESGDTRTGPGTAAVSRTAPQGKYSGRFRAIDELTGAPAAGLGYSVELANGRVVEGFTDADGYTELIVSDQPDAVHLRWHVHLRTAPESSSEGDNIC